MNRGVYPLASSMINGLNRIDVISNNLANVNTNGFKEDSLSQGTFNAYMDRTKEKEIKLSQLTQHNINLTVNTIPKIDTKYTSNRVGKIVVTDNEFDFAIKDPNTFFKIRLPNGKIALTRDGAFKISANNKVITNEGYEVLSKENKPLYANNNIFSEIGLINTDFKNLEKIGDNNFTILDNTKIKNVTPTKDILVKGAIEKSNVNMVKSMVSLIEAHRTFELNQKALMAIDEINDKAINKLGSAQ